MRECERAHGQKERSFRLLDCVDDDDAQQSTLTKPSFAKLSSTHRFLRTAATAVETAQAKSAAQGVEVRKSGIGTCFPRERKIQSRGRLARFHFTSRRRCRRSKIALSSLPLSTPTSLSSFQNFKTTVAPRPLRPLPDRKPPRRRCPHRALQLPVREKRRGKAHPPRRGHRRRALDERIRRGRPPRPRLDGHRVGRRP